MDALLAHLLEGEDPPADLEAALAADPQARLLADELSAIDAAAASLPLLEAPSALRADVLAAVDAEMPRPADAPRRWLSPRFAIAAVAVAAALLAVVLVPSAPPTGDIEKMVARGSDEVQPVVGLRMAVASDGAVERFQVGTAYAPGDVLYFRYDLTAPAWLHLVRVDGSGAALLHTQRAESGTADLVTDGQALGYALERGEERAVFALVAHAERLTADAIDALDLEHVCDDVRELGGWCAAEAVEVAQ